MQLAEDISHRTHCIRMKVGAVLVQHTRIVSIGYNGPPSKAVNCDEDADIIRRKGCSVDRKGHCDWGMHAEQNAILYAAKHKQEVQGASLYTTLAPCLACARVIYTMGIQEVVYSRSYAAFKGEEKEEGVAFLQKFGVSVRQYRGKAA